MGKKIPIGGIAWQVFNAWRTDDYAFASGDESTICLDNNSYAWAWGYYDYGQLGDNSMINRSSPVSVIGDYQWKLISKVSHHAVTLNANSYAWGWGCNTAGQLGDNTTGSKSSPSSVIGNKQWRAISAGQWVTVALDVNSYAWTWGSNYYGELGNNSTVYSSSPISVFGGRQWIAIEAGTEFVIGLDSNSYAWAWGYNSSGMCGDNTILNRSSPVSVVGNRQWSKLYCGLSHVMVLNNNSYAWAWGGTNGYGQIGDGTGTARSSPVSVIGNIQFAKLFRPGSSTSGGINNVSDVYIWGNNTYGAFGNGTTTNRSSPTIITNLKNFKNITFGTYNTLGINPTNNWLYGWGYNNYGEIGDNTRTNKALPTGIVMKYVKANNLFGRKN